MKLWLLNARDGNPIWDFGYDMNHGLVVRAPDEDAARALAASVAADEKGTAWTDPANSTCDELTGDGLIEIVLSDFHAG